MKTKKINRGGVLLLTLILVVNILLPAGAWAAGFNAGVANTDITIDGVAMTVSHADTETVKWLGFTVDSDGYVVYNGCHLTLDGSNLVLGTEYPKSGGAYTTVPIPLDFTAPESLSMRATQGSSKLTIDPCVITNTGTKGLKLSQVEISAAYGWSLVDFSTDFTTADSKNKIAFKTGTHDFSSGSYTPGEKIAAGRNATVLLEGKISEKADLTTATQVASIVLTVEKAPLEIVTWADGTDEQIVAMVAAADAGKINLSDYWHVGDTRTVHLSAMDATNVGETHAEQDIQLVLMHQGGYKLADGGTCNFVVGQKDSLNESGHMNSTNTNTGSWEGSARRAWCNNEYKNAMPSTLQPIFKQFKTITAETYDGTTLKTSLDYFALPAEREVFGAGYGYAGGKGYANNTEAACEDIFQFDWYQTAGNRIKKLGISGDIDRWWERSPYCNYSSHFCYVYSDGNAYSNGAYKTYGLAPFGCI